MGNAEYMGARAIVHDRETDLISKETSLQETNFSQTEVLQFRKIFDEMVEECGQEDVIEKTLIRWQRKPVSAEMAFIGKLRKNPPTVSAKVNDAVLQAQA